MNKAKYSPRKEMIIKKTTLLVALKIFDYFNTVSRGFDAKHIQYIFYGVIKQKFFDRPGKAVNDGSEGWGRRKE